MKVRTNIFKQELECYIVSCFDGLWPSEHYFSPFNKKAAGI